MTLKLRILRSLTRLFIILVSLMRSSFSEKMLVSNRCISGLMSNLIKKSWTVSSVRSPCMQSSQFRNSLVQVMCNADWNSLGKSKWHRFVVSVIIHTYICLNINWKRNSLTYRWRLDQKEFHFGCRKIFFRSTGWKKEKKVIKIIILMRLIYICLLKVNKHQSVWAGKNLTCPKNCTTFNLNSSFPVHKTKLKK